MNAKKPDRWWGVKPVEGVRMEAKIEDWTRLAAIVIVEPDLEDWGWTPAGRKLAAQLEDWLLKQWTDSTRAVYVMNAMSPECMPSFYFLWEIAFCHARGWGLSDEGALLVLRRWLDGLSLERGGDRTAPIAVVGAVMEMEVLQTANTVARAGWPAVVAREACLTVSEFIGHAHHLKATGQDRAKRGQKRT